MSQALESPRRGEELANDLLAAFQSGYPLDNLRRLLNAEDSVAVATGMWIASELGASVRPLFPEIVERLRHPFARVRFFALDVLTSCAGPEDENALNGGLDLLDDPDQAVRWKALVYLATMSEAALRALRDLAMRLAPASPRAQGLQMMLSAMASREVEPVIQGLASGDAELHRYAAVVAARMVHQDSTPLRIAMASPDTTVRQFARDMAARAGISTAASNG